MKKNILIFIGLVVAISVIAVIYIFFPEKEEQEQFESLVPDNPSVINLYNMANPSNDIISIGDVLRKNTFSNEFILGTAFVNFLKNHPNHVGIISEDDINLEIHKIFGTITYAHDSGYIISDYLCAFKYDKANHSYSIIKGCTGSEDSTLIRKVVSAKKSSTEYIITEKLILVKKEVDETEPLNKKITYKIYNDVDEGKLLKSYSLNDGEEEKTVSLDDYLNDASTYEYHFVFDGENFVYKSIKRV